MITAIVWIVWYAAVGAIAYDLAAETFNQPGARLGVAITWPGWVVVVYFVAMYCGFVLAWRAVRGRV